MQAATVALELIDVDVVTDLDDEIPVLVDDASAKGAETARRRMARSQRARCEICIAHVLERIEGVTRRS
jgi:hypothetical protein